VLDWVGAPRSMKMGTIRSPCPYDAAARRALQSANLQRHAISHYAPWGLSSRFGKVVRLPFDSGHADQSRDRRDVPGPKSRSLQGEGKMEYGKLAIGAGYCSCGR
jgi:hypothetical protein